MTGEYAEYGAEQEKQQSNSPGTGDGARIISYNFSEDERPDGIKVRVKIRIETGRKGRAIDARQAEGIREYLKWVLQQEAHDRHGRPGRPSR